MTDKNHRRPWADDAIAELRRLYPNTPTRDLADRFERSIRSVYEKALGLGLKKSREYLASGQAGRLDGIRGMPTRFKPGLIPWNKDTHFTAGGRSAETRFKPGHRGGRAAEVYKPVGTERISKDGYLERKINEGMPLQRRWRAVHLMLWEAENGPLPAGHALVFKDGNKQHITLGNLELVTRAELMRRNSYHNNYPKEVALAIQLRGALNRKINARSKKHEQQDHC